MLYSIKPQNHKDFLPYPFIKSTNANNLTSYTADNDHPLFIRYAVIHLPTYKALKIRATINTIFFADFDIFEIKPFIE